MKASSRFYSSLGLLLLLNVIIKPVWIFGIDRQVQNIVGTTTYGTYFSLLGFTIVFSFLLDWGFTAYFNSKLATGAQEFTGHLYRFLLIKLSFILLYTGVVYLAALSAGMDRWDIFHPIVAIQVFTSLFVFLRSIITANQWFRTDAWLSVLDKTLMILLGGSFIYFPSQAGQLTITVFLWVQCSCTIFAVLVAILILWKKGIHFYSTDRSWSAIPVLKAAFPFAVTVFLMSVHNRLDGFLLERRSAHGAYQAGIYAASYRLLDAANMFGYLVASFLLPYIARHWSRGEPFSSVVLNSRHLLLVYAIVVAVTVYFLAPWIAALLYHRQDDETIRVLQYCLPALIGYSLVQVYGTAMTATGLIIPFCIINLLAMLLNAGINLFFIPSLGAMASCWAAIISQGCCGVACLLYFSQQTKTPIHYRSLLLYALLAVLLSLYYYGVKDWAVSKWILLLVAGVITLLAVIFTRLFDIKKWVHLYLDKNSS